MASAVVLRPATPTDIDRVYAWANDPVTRAVSFSHAEIPYSEHLAWFEQQLERQDRNLMIASLWPIDGSGEQPIAAVRLDRWLPARAEICVISINVAPEARGRGFGVATLEAARVVAGRLGFTAIHALIRPDNHASVRAFTRAGYVQDLEFNPPRPEQPALRFIRALE